MQSIKWALMIVAALVGVFAIISSTDGSPVRAPRPVVGKHRARRPARA